jgi:acyl dehydratase
MQFAGLSGDFNPIHTDEDYAKTTPFKQRVAHGLLGAIMASGLVSQLGIYDGTMIALLSQTIKYKNPVFIGDTITMHITVKHKKETSNPEQGVILFDAKLENQRQETVMEGDWTTLMLR